MGVWPLTIEKALLHFFKQKIKNKTRFANWLIELANSDFDLNTHAFLKSVKTFLDKEVTAKPFEDSKSSFPFY